MKKSNTLMIAYIIFLFVSVILCEIFKSDKIVAISTAATMAGYFFPVADFTYQVSNNKKELSMLNLNV